MFTIPVTYKRKPICYHNRIAIKCLLLMLEITECVIIEGLILGLGPANESLSLAGRKPRISHVIVLYQVWPSASGVWPSINWSHHLHLVQSILISRFMGPIWVPSVTDRTQVGPMLAPWTLLSGVHFINVLFCNSSTMEISFYSNPKSYNGLNVLHMCL